MTIDNILQYVAFKGLSVNEFSKQIEVSNGYFAKQKTANGAVSSKIIEKIVSSFPELNPYWLITGNGPMINTNKPVLLPDGIPIYDIEASAGQVALFSDMKKEIPIGFINIPNLPNCDGAIKVVGDSMYPLIKSGDLAIYKIIESANSIIFGEMYLIDFTLENQDYLMTKYLKKSKTDSNIVLVSYNKHHDDLEIPKLCIRNLALIKANIRFNMLK